MEKSMITTGSIFEAMITDGNFQEIRIYEILSNLEQIYNYNGEYVPISETSPMGKSVLGKIKDDFFSYRVDASRIIFTGNILNVFEKETTKSYSKIKQD
ncbi:MAG: hypothetical protein ACK5HP_01925 [Bacilli bacterium]